MAKVFLDKIKATAHIESVVATENLPQGQFVTLGVLGDDGESRLVTKATDKHLPMYSLQKHQFHMEIHTLI